jgi:lysophospholipid acyltransferase (LPLAT)-like uncharacterized protein
MRRVDNIPWHLKPFFLVWGYISGWTLYAWALLIRLTCKITFEGEPLPARQQSVVYCIWHRDLALYFGVFNKVSKQVWLNDPAWYMKPVHVLLHLTGVEHICLGSSGNNGKAALENVIGFLKQGYSTVVACDGPAGPPMQLKPGVLWMSRDAGIPIIPLRFSYSKATQLGGWDKKIVPLPFSKITVIVGAGIQVTDANFNISAFKITAILNTKQITYEKEAG